MYFPREKIPVVSWIPGGVIKRLKTYFLYSFLKPVKIVFLYEFGIILSWMKVSQATKTSRKIGERGKVDTKNDGLMPVYYVFSFINDSPFYHTIRLATTVTTRD